MQADITNLSNRIARELDLPKEKAYAIANKLDKAITKLWIKKNEQKPLIQKFVFQKQPPNNYEVEANFVGKALCFPTKTLPLATAITDDYFHDPRHAWIWTAVASLWAEDKPTDLNTVFAELEAYNKLQEAGGKRYLKALQADAVMGGIEECIEDLTKYYVARAIWAKTFEAAHEVMDADIDNIHEFRTALIEELGGLGKNQKRTYSDSRDLAEAFSSQLTKYMDALVVGDGITGHRSPIKALDGVTSGWQDTDLIVLAGRPGMGKTAMAISDAAEALKNGERVVFFSLEMSAEQLGMRLFQVMKYTKLDDLVEIHIDGPRLSREGEIIINKWVQEELPSYEIYIDDTPGVNHRYILDKCLNLQQKHGKIHRIYCDYLQLMGSTHKNIVSKEHITSINSMGCKKIAKTMDCPFILLSQLSRAVEQRNDKRPQLSDLRESGAIEQDADIVIFTYRDEYYKNFEDSEGESTEGVGEIIIAKHRNGSLDTVKAFFNAPFTKWMDLSAKPVDYTNKSNERYKKESSFDLGATDLDDFDF